MTVATDKVTNLALPIDESNEEVLGSVTHESHSSDKCFPIQLRTSARVSKKLKLDSQNVPSPSTAERKDPKPPEEKVADQKSNTVRRVHELWSPEDKNAFFEALNEYGKDFDAIQTHMNNKRKKRGINHNISKNRDQARHFYYRTWHKISKYLKFPQEIKKAVREQYGLINFGEFRRKIGFVSEKNSVKLNELIYSGNTQVRVKGKTIRIKTPVCRALRKLNQLQETTADVKLPTRILVELRPRNNESWCRVQSLAMNPRVRTNLPLQQLLVPLILHLDKKWQHSNLADAKEKSVSTDGKENVSIAEEPDDQCAKSLLRLAPRDGINIVPPSVRSGEFVTSSNISLMAYEQKFNVGCTEIADHLKQIQMANKPGKANKSGKKQSTEDEKSKTLSENDNQCVPGSSANDGSKSSLDEGSAVPDPDFVSSTINQLLSACNDREKDTAEETDWNSPAKEEFDIDSEISTSENKQQIIRKAQAGWTVKNADCVRIGDLYLMFGAESKLQLDYWWDYDFNGEKCNAEKTPSSVALNDCSKRQKLSQSLNKLISVAKLYLNKEKERCTCGQMGKPTSKFVTGRSRVMNKPKNSSYQDRNIMNTPPSEISRTKMFPPSLSRINSVQHVNPRSVSSFKEQLDLQYYRRRNSDKQRTLQSLTKVTVQVIKPKQENATDSPVTDTSDPAIDSVDSSCNRVDSNVTSLCLEPSEAISSTLDPFKSANNPNDLNANLLLHDEDSKSSCSTITRILKQALPEVIPRTIQPSRDGLSTPVIQPSSHLLNSGNLLGEKATSPAWSMSEASNFSIGNLLAQFDVPSKSTVDSLDEDSRFPSDVETQFQRLINESSIDYTEKFADLAAQIASEMISPKL